MFYPIFKTRLASARKSARLVPMRERQNTTMSTEASRSGTCAQRTCFLFSTNLNALYLNEHTEEWHTHVGHVTDRHKLTGSCQVEAVHFVLHAARYFTITATKICNHQRGRSETQQQRQRQTLLMKHKLRSKTKKCDQEQSECNSQVSDDAFSYTVLINTQRSSVQLLNYMSQHTFSSKCVQSCKWYRISCFWPGC